MVTFMNELGEIGTLNCLVSDTLALTRDDHLDSKPTRTPAFVSPKTVGWSISVLTADTATALSASLVKLHR